MALNKQDMLKLLGMEDELLQPGQTPVTPPLRGYTADSMRAALGFSGPAVTQPVDPPPLQPALDKHDPGFFTALGVGLKRGGLTPFGFIDPVEKVLEKVKSYAPEGVTEYVGYGTGMLLGFLGPAAAAYSLGGMAATGAGLVEMADGVASLTTLGTLARGATAGAILGAGEAAEDGGERAKNMLRNIALFGGGDMAIHGLARAVSALGTRVAKGIANPIAEELAKVAQTGRVQTKAEAEIYGRALGLADQLYPEAAMVEESVRVRRARLLKGLDDIGLKNIKAGEIRMFKGVDQQVGDLQDILDQIPGIRYATASTKWGATTFKTIAVSTEEGVDQRVLDSIRRNGFFPGQRVVHRGTEKIILGLNKETGAAELFTPRTGKSQYVKTALEDLTFLPMGTWRAGPTTVKGASKYWIDFLNEHGEFPNGGFKKAFEDFAKRKKWTAGQTEDMGQFFAQHQYEAWKKYDPESAAVLERLKLVPKNFRPTTQFREFAAQNGYIVDSLREDNKWKVMLIDGMDNYKHVFDDQEMAHAFMVERGRQLPELFKEFTDVFPVDTEMTGLEGIGVQQPHSAAYPSSAGSFIPKSLWFSHFFLPRATVFRSIENKLIELMGDEAPRVFGSFTRLQMGATKARDESNVWIRDLMKIYGKRSPNIRPDMEESAMNLFEKPRRLWDSYAKEKGLNAIEVQTVSSLRDWFSGLFEEFQRRGVVRVGADDYIENYLGWARRLPSGDWEEAVRNWLATIGKPVDEEMINFVREMERTGSDSKLEKNPFMYALRFVRSGYSRIHVSEPFKEAQAMLKEIPETNDQFKYIKNSFKDYLTYSYGGAPEAFYIARLVTDDVLRKKLGVELTDRDFERFVNTITTLNYGAFMGFRPALAVRNLTQPLVTTLPLVGGKYLGKGIAAAMTEAGKKETIEAGAMATSSLAAPAEDQIMTQALFNAIGKSGPSGKNLGRAYGALTKLEYWSRVGVGSETVDIAGKEFRPGLYSRSDDFNRVIAYQAQKFKTIDAFNKFNLRELDQKGFEDAAGLSFLGKATTREFWNVYNRAGEDKAIQFLGTQVANETQWIYQLGAGPALFSHGVGRLFGMYGTWPSWYLTHLARGAQRMVDSSIPIADKLRFAGYTIGAHAAFATAGWTVGVNLTQWSPLNSLAWGGSPSFEWFTDAMDIITRQGPSGPSTKGQLALSKIGLKDTGNTPPVPVLGQFDPREGYGLDWRPGGPAKMAAQVLANFTPGWLQGRDFYKATQLSGTPKSQLIPNPIPAAAWRAFGFSPVTGQSWPKSSR